MGSSALGAIAALDAWAAKANAVREKAGDGPSAMPTVFIGHGSPMNAVRDNSFTRFLRSFAGTVPRPTAVAVVSAHWLTDGVTAAGVQTRPRTIHDFGGFPRELHEVQHAAPGAPELARAAAGLVRNGARPGMPTEAWGLDHGAWTVLRHLYPKADIPVFQISIDYPKPAPFHYAVGQQLRALRSRGVLVLGSGNIVHNLGAMDRGAADGPATRDWARSFDDAVALALSQRNDGALQRYEQLDTSARTAVPTPDHYWPLLYVLGAAKPDEMAVTVFEGFQSGTLGMRCVKFG